MINLTQMTGRENRNLKKLKHNVLKDEIGRRRKREIDQAHQEASQVSHEILTRSVRRDLKGLKVKEKIKKTNSRTIEILKKKETTKNQSRLLNAMKDHQDLMLKRSVRAPRNM